MDQLLDICSLYYDMCFYNMCLWNPSVCLPVWRTISPPHEIQTSANKVAAAARLRGLARGIKPFLLHRRPTVRFLPGRCRHVNFVNNQRKYYQLVSNSNKLQLA